MCAEGREVTVATSSATGPLPTFSDGLRWLDMEGGAGETLAPPLTDACVCHCRTFIIAERLRCSTKLPLFNKASII